METYPLTIRPRCDTENEWIKYNPVLKYREFVVSVDKNVARYKIGDGISKYDKLQFVSLEMADGEPLYDFVNSWIAEDDDEIEFNVVGTCSVNNYNNVLTPQFVINDVQTIQNYSIN